MKPHEFHIQAADGLRLYGRSWEPTGEPRAVICLVHGLGEHSARYAHVATALNEAGHALLGFDLRGHGRSQGPRGHIPSYDILMDDIGHLLQEALVHFGSRPRFLYGHSLGASLALNYVLRRRPPLAGVIATGPLLRVAVPPPSWKLIVARAMYNVWPSFRLANGLDREGLSRDPEVVRSYSADPLVHDRISARLGWDILQSGEWALEHAADFPLPLMLMHGGADRLTSAPACAEFARKVSRDCTFKLWEGLYHEIHNEPEHQEVLECMVDWLEKNEVQQ